MALRNTLKPVLAVATLCLGLSSQSCTRSPSSDDSDTTAISNRPQSYDRFIAVLKLATPALLSSAKKTNGVIIVDESLKAEILAEQEATIADLHNISPDIQVLYRYKMVLNGLAIIAPRALEAKFRTMASVSYVEGEGAFERMAPVRVAESTVVEANLDANSSVAFIGAARVHDEVKVPGTDGPVAVLGQGIKVGVIDTGIDYTHAMFGGAGTEQAYKDNDPTTVEADSFPTAKVKGGIDLVGTDYDNAAPRFEQHVPKPDADPLDEAGHGSHVSGTIAGHGDGSATYSGVAPAAELYGIKVFGKAGSTGDAVIIAALEFAADPNGDFDGADKLDVINLSLGSSFGTPHLLYQEAAGNLVKGDTVMVASAGNSGDESYIVGAPSTADDALSVAASIDGMDHNWKFRAVSFASAAHPSVLAEALEASFSKPIADAGPVNGKLVYLGTAAADLTDEQKAAVHGNVAFIDRGAVTFAIKGQRAFEAGAIGLVVANNVDGDAFGMGGDAAIDIPAIMISKALGDALKADMPQGDVIIAFLTDGRIEKPALVDTLTDFSSRGPRSIDGALKPEISAPGANVISAKMGSGDKAVQMSGTSMAAPHMTGVMALMKQIHPELDVKSLKALVMETALGIKDKNGVPYPVAHMGSGRVQAFEAATAKLIAAPAALSLGEVLVEEAKVVRQSLTLTNITDAAVTLTLTAELKAGLTVTAPTTVALAAHESKALDLKFKIAPSASTDASTELDGFIKVTGDAGSYHIPVLAVVNRTTRVNAKALKILATSPADAAGAEAELTLVNDGKQTGEALPFNLLGLDERKAAARRNVSRNGVCDLESSGYRIIKKTVDGVEMELLQVAVKLYNPVTSWHVCEVSVQVDADGDGIADQELLGTYMQLLSNNAAQVQDFVSALTDAGSMRKIRSDYETSFPNANDPVYTPAIVDSQDYLTFAHSTISVVTADLSKLKKTAAGDLKIKLAVLADTTSPEADDFLGAEDKWKTITPTVDGQAFVNLPESVTLKAGESQTVDLTKGSGKGELIVYLPFNSSTDSAVAKDNQAKVLKPKYGL